MDQPNTITILADRLPEARKVLDRLIRKAQRYGNTEVAYQVSEVFAVFEKRTNPFTFMREEVRGPDRVTITVSGPAPRVGPFEFLAKVDHGDGGNIVDIIPGRTVSPRFRDTPSLCEHCNTKRRRNETFVVCNTETGEEVQVGRTCLADYTAHATPEVLLSCFAFLKEVRDFSEEYGGRGWGDNYQAETVLATTTITIRLFGWCSKAQAGEDLESTASIVQNFLCPPLKPDKFNQHIIARNKQIAEAARFSDADYAKRIMTWLTEGGAGDGDYGHNLCTAVGRGIVPGKRLGLVCSAVQSYERAQENEIRLTREREAAKDSVWLGAVGDRLRDLEVSFVNSKFVCSTHYGDLIANKFRDASGNNLVWLTGEGCGLNPGEKALLSGTVKEHGEFKGIKETKLSRCKVSPLPILGD